jgi:hypothetical protein
MDAGRPSTAATSAGVDHVRLAYQYLDESDFDAYGSLFDEHALVTRPDAPCSRGRAEILDLHASQEATRHTIFKIIAEADTVAAVGRLTRATRPPQTVDFADFFTLSNEGLLLGYRRFYFTAPR